MSNPTKSKRAGQRAWVLLLAMVAGCAGEESHGTQTVGAAVISLAMGSDLRRPAVEYDHALHQKVLDAEGCELCHPKTPRGEQSLKFMRVKDPVDPDELMDLYHQKCMDCHIQKQEAGVKSGPLVCGDCHRDRGTVVSAHRPMVFDYSLHQRHLLAADKKCETCHHVYDQARKKLVYKKGQESACRDCHGALDQGNNLSLKNASHTDCIGCHREQSRKRDKTGPWTCLGCHDAQQQKTIAKLTRIPRLMRGQPDRTWISAKGARARLVAFDHLLHEPHASNCSTCHHKTLKACDECHKLLPGEESGGVSLEKAYHQASSDHSCVGCHRAETSKKTCAGCHFLAGTVPSEGACGICHRGPEPSASRPNPAAPEALEVSLAALPETSEAFPEVVRIDTLAKKFKPASLPHRKMVEALDRTVRDSKLATSFHQRLETLCAGCHHHSPVGVRPSPCRSCHDDKGLPDSDKPDLFTAYHRQCVGCHQRMEIKKQGCTDCHQEVSP